MLSCRLACAKRYVELVKGHAAGFLLCTGDQVQNLSNEEVAEGFKLLA